MKQSIFNIFNLKYCCSLSSILNRGLLCNAHAVNSSYNADYRSENVFKKSYETFGEYYHL